MEKFEEVNSAPKPAEEIESMDIGLSANINTVPGLIIAIDHANEGDMYGLYFEVDGRKEQVAFLPPGGTQVRKEFDEVTAFLRGKSWKDIEEAKDAVPGFIADLHGGMAER